MSGYIKLGLPTDLRDYTLRNTNSYGVTAANPFATKVNNSDEFGSLSGYNEWPVTDWRAGVGKRDPEQGQLFSLADTRFPNQLILPMGWEYPYTTINLSGVSAYKAADTTITATLIKTAMSFNSGVGGELSEVWVYADAADGTSITVQILNSSAAQVTSGSATIEKYRPGPIFVRVPLTSTTLSASTEYYVAVSGTGVTLPGTESTGRYVYHNVSSVLTPAFTGFTYTSTYVRTASTLGLQDGSGKVLKQDGTGGLDLSYGGTTITNFAKVRGRVFASYSNQVIELLANDTTSTITTTASVVTDLQTVDNELWIAYGSGYKKYSTTTGTVTDVPATSVNYFTMFGGYLWRAYERSLWYSADGAAWTTVSTTVGAFDAEITGLAGMEGYMYVATFDGLYIVAPGDILQQMASWPTVDARNGKGMASFEGALYVPLAEDMLRVDASGAILQVGMRTGEELPDDVQGYVTALHPTNYFLLASVVPAMSDGYGSLWAWNGQGWHCLGLQPQSVHGAAIYVDTDSGYVYWGGNHGLIARSKYPASVVNPARDTGNLYFGRYGWVEFDRFYGGFVALQKDIESLYVDTEAMDSATISIYWQDDGSTDWELLGSSTADDFELRWSDYDTRPNTKWLRLGILLRTDDETKTPIARAHRLKFQTMINDRRRWNLIIPVNDNQQMPDRTINPFAGTQQKAHLDSLIERVGPFIFEDVDGTQYEVKIIGWRAGITKFEINGLDTVIEYAYTLDIEQLNSGTYN